jgi:hypothetical protein
MTSIDARRRAQKIVYWVESIETRADRSLRKAKTNLHPVVHVRNTEAVRVLGHCKVAKERRILTQGSEDISPNRKKG